MSGRRFLFGIAFLTLSLQTNAIEVGQIDDFEDGTTMGWSKGGQNPFPPENVPTGGDTGTDDNYLSNTSAGGFGAGSRHKMFTSSIGKWAGDYIAAGVSGIRMNIANFGTEAAPVRVVFWKFAIYCWATEPALVPADGSWASYEFSISESAMTHVSGSEAYNDALSDVPLLTIVAANEPACIGDPLDTTIGYDDIEATLAADADTDGVADSVDNCTLIANPDQRDTDFDNFGNACDSDFDQNCVVDFTDVGILRAFFLLSGDFDTDLNGDGTVDFIDLGILKSFFLAAPGPTGLPNTC